MPFVMAECDPREISFFHHDRAFRFHDPPTPLPHRWIKAKTQRSIRTIDVAADTLAKLDLTGEWVFTNSGWGRAEHPTIRCERRTSTPTSGPALTKAKEKGLTKRPRPHDLRHTNASWLIQAGVPLTVIQRHLGHESIQTSSDRYGHLDRKSSRVVADVVGNALKPTKAHSKQKNAASL